MWVYILHFQKGGGSVHRVQMFYLLIFGKLGILIFMITFYIFKILDKNEEEVYI